MSSKLNFRQRCYDPEIMDNLDMEGEELAATLRQIAGINRYLGGTAVVLSGLKKLLSMAAYQPQDQALRIIDLGCGGGEILRAIADWGRKKNLKMQLIGVDANAFTIDCAAAQSKDYPEIDFKVVNIFSDEFCHLEYDIALCSLFLHHFREDEITQLLKSILKNAKIGLIVNDLQRSIYAYRLFQLLTWTLSASPMVRYDGALSIRRGFLRLELEKLLADSNVKHFSINWRWAFRYQVLALCNNLVP